MTIHESRPQAASPLSTRLSRLADLTVDEQAALEVAATDQRRWPARRDVIAEGAPIRHAWAVLRGWACRQHVLPDGRRQILGVLLPGDLIGACRHVAPLSPTTIATVGELVLCPLPEADRTGGLADAYAHSAALDAAYLFAHVTRIGRLDASERIADWLLETLDRLTLAGVASGDGFALPLTQEMLGDALGLTSVHVNRTLQAMRRAGVLSLGGGMVSFPDRARLERLTGYRPARVSARPSM